MDKRNFIRTLFRTQGELITNNKIIPFNLINVSLKGALIQTPENEKISLNQEVDLSIYLENTDIAITTRATLVRREGDKIGLRFKEIDVDSLTHLRRLLELNTAMPERIEEELWFLKEDCP